MPTREKKTRRAMLRFGALAALAVSPAPVVQAADDPAISPEELFLMTEYGLDHAAARRQLMAEEDASRLAAQLRKESPNSFAGIWIDHADGGRVQIASTDPDQGRAMAMRSRDDVQMRHATHSLRTLERAVRTLDRKLARARGGSPSDADLFETMVDVPGNAIRLTVWRGSPLLSVASELSRSPALDGVEVIIEAVDEPLSPPELSAATCWTQACNETVGGVDMFKPDGGYANCTQGFNVTRVIGGVTHYMVLTAGHCGGRYSTSPEAHPCSVSTPNIKHTWMQDRASGTSPQTLGKEYHFVCGNGSGNWNDWGVIDLTTPSSWKPQNQVLIQAFGVDKRDITSVASVGTALVGKVVCKTGQVTGTGCGTLVSHDAGVTSPSTGTSVRGVGRVDNVVVCQGDSGGPWFSNNQAVGIQSLIGGSTHTEGRCTNDFTRSCDGASDCGGAACWDLKCSNASGGRNYFTWVSRAQSSLGVKVMTARATWK